MLGQPAALRICCATKRVENSIQWPFLRFAWRLAFPYLDLLPAEECLKSPRQLFEKKLSAKWRELHQKDNQPLFLSINAGPGDELQFIGKKPDGSTWISGAMSVCSYAENRYQVKLDRIDQAPALLGPKSGGNVGLDCREAVHA